MIDGLMGGGPLALSDKYWSNFVGWVQIHRRNMKAYDVTFSLFSFQR
jgi:hypothetical protein